MRIAGDIPGLGRVASPQAAVITISESEEPNRWRRNFRLLRAAATADYLVINFSAAEILFFSVCLAVIPFQRCRLVVLDFFLLEPHAWMRPLWRWSLRRIYRMLVYFRDSSAFERLYGLPPGKFHYIPFKVNSWEAAQTAEVTDKGYVFVGGRSRRDFRTLFEAVAELPYPVKVITGPERDIRPHGSSLEGLVPPPNVELYRNDGDSRFFLELLAGARLVVVPILKGISTQTGIAVYLLAMALRKCVIVSQALGVGDVLLDGQACIVPAGDADALRDAIVRLWNDDALRQQVAAAGYRYAAALGGEEELMKSILQSLA